MIDTIVFYNNFHNGDIFFSKGYVKNIIEQFPEISFYYSHKNDPKITRDLNIGFMDMNNYSIPQSHKLILDKNRLFINTWIGNYIDGYLDCNWKSLHIMYEHIFKYLEELFNINIQRLNINEYSPSIDFSYYDIPVDFNCDYDQTIIFSNGPVLSGQSILESTDFIVESLLNYFPEKKLILTHKTNINSNNILYTSDIIKTSGSDLNEISWLASKCKYIIGRQSGPFSFMQTDKNINDKKKIIISFSNNEKVNWLYEIKTKSKYVNLIETDKNDLINNIIKFMENNEKL